MSEQTTLTQPVNQHGPYANAKPGTWAWACAVLLRDGRVRRPTWVPTTCIRLDEQEGDLVWQDEIQFVVDRADLEATDWEEVP